MRNPRAPQLLGLLLCLALAPACARADGERATVTLRAEATVNTPEVALAQVADVTAAGAEVAAKLAAVSLSSAPVPGGSRVIPADYVWLRLRRFGFEPAQVELVGEAVTVHRTGGAGTVSVAAASPTPVATATPVVRRGQSVETEVRCGGVAVRAAGFACGDAGVGDMVEVRMAQGSRRLIGRVAGPGQVLLIIPGPTAAYAERVP